LLLVEEAGGTVSDFSGQPYRLGGPNILATNGSIHEEMRKVALEISQRRSNFTAAPLTYEHCGVLEIIGANHPLLILSNIFNDVCWYGHLKYRSEALWKVIFASWGIAFFEYCFQVPANRIGSYEFNTAQLKTIQEVITLAVFSVFSVLYLGEKLKWNYAAGFGCIALAVFFVFHKW